MISTIKAWILSYGLALAFVFGLAGWTMYGVQTIRLARSERDTATLHSAWDTQLLQAAKVAETTGTQYRAEEARRNDAINKAVQDEAIKTKSAQADAVSAGDALERLRKRVAVAASCGATPGNTIAATSSAAASAPADVQSDVLGRVGEAAGLIAAYGDAARIAGEACQVSYQGLGK